MIVYYVSVMTMLFGATLFGVVRMMERKQTEGHRHFERHPSGSECNTGRIGR